MFDFIFAIIPSAFLASTLSNILVVFFTKKLSFNVFSPQYLIKEVSVAKTQDLLEFPIFLFLLIILFFLNRFVISKSRLSKYNKSLILLIYTIFSVIIYIQTFFIDHSLTQTLGLIILCSAVTYLFLIFFANKENVPTGSLLTTILANGLTLGLYLAILSRNFSTTVAYPIFFLICTPLLFLLFSNIFKSKITQPTFVILLCSIFFPYQKVILLILLVILILIILSPLNLFNLKYQKHISLLSILFIILYNPLFYFGTYDNIEEGFWAGWLERLLNGQVIYRDFAAHQPPLLLWGLHLFSKLLGPSLFTIRIYFHLLQIVGLVGIYYALCAIVKNSWIKTTIFVSIISYNSMLVRNNIEIRLASGIVPLIILQLYFVKKRNIYLFTAGILSAVAFFISTETGISSVVALGISLALFKTRALIKTLPIMLGGIIVGAILPVSVLLVSGSFSKFIEYIIYYSNAFSAGYLNVPLQRPESLRLIQWDEVIRFAYSPGFLWELIKFLLGASLIVILIKKLKKGSTHINHLFVSLTFFGLILARSALGRSDPYHIIFVWIVCLLLIGYFLEQLLRYSQRAAVIIMIVMLLTIGQESLNQNLIQNQLIKFEAYANPSGTYPQYQTTRANILPNIDAIPKVTDDMIKFLQSETSKDDKIFVFPISPEIYFLADRKNATSFDMPLSFISAKYQSQMISELKMNSPKIVIYNPDMGLSQITSKDVGMVDAFILKNYSVTRDFGKYQVLTKIN